MGGAKYITVAMDVFTRKMWVGLHKRKSDIDQWLIDLIKREQTQTGLTLKHLHSDNGTEVCTDEVSKFLTNQGSIHTTSTVYTPQHNSLVERRNRTLIEMMRAQHHHSDSFLGLFGENALACNHVLDRSLNSHHPSLTPIEHYKERKPNTAHLHVWGCDAYFKLQKRERQNKMSEKAQAGIFIGYDVHNDTYYRILDVDTLDVIRARDVVFDEGKFEQMKRLKDKMKDEDKDVNEQDVTPKKGTLNFDDYLPVRLLNDREAIADMFPAVPDMNNKSDDKITLENKVTMIT